MNIHMCMYINNICVNDSVYIQSKISLMKTRVFIFNYT